MSGEGFNLGNAYGAVVIDVSGVGSAMQQAQKAISSGLSGVGQQISNVVSGIGDGLETIGKSITSIGTKMTAIGAPVAAGFIAATKQAMNFDESITNIAAVLNLTSDESAKLGDQLKGIGASSRAGAQGVAQAFYDIAGGVADASTHMAILQAAIKTSEAGNSDLAGTTNALISVMNSYNLTAEQAGMVSDVLTRTVGMGVGTMDQFAAAFPAVTGVANSLGISFENLGQMMAYLTTKGNTASEASTQLSALMTGMLKPNTDMADALKEIGFQSGEAAVQQLGLVGAYQAIAKTQTAASKGMGTLIGRVEGIRAVTSFGSKDVETFFNKFKTGVKGATDAAQKIQNSSMAAKWDILNARIQDVAITLGTTLFPILTDLMTKITPIITSITQWIEKNPQLVQQIALLVGGLVVFGPIIAAIGFAISTVGSIIAGLGVVIGIILSPIGLLIAAGAAIVYLFKDQIGGALSVAWDYIQKGEGLFKGLAAGIMALFGSNEVTQGIANFLLQVQDFFDHFQDRVKLYGSLFQMYFMYYIGNPLSDIWNKVSPHLQDLLNWFQSDGIPAIQNALANFKTNYLDPFLNGLGELWSKIKPKFDDLPKTFSDASTAAKELVNMGLLVVFDTLNKAAISAGLLVGIIEIFFITALHNATTAAQGIVGAVGDWVEKNQKTLEQLGDLGLSLILAMGIFKLYAIVVNAAAIASGLGAGLAGAIKAATSAAWASVTGFLAAAAPIVALMLAIYGVIEAYKKFVSTVNDLKPKYEAAGAAAGVGIQNGLTQKDVNDQYFKQAQQQFGGGLIGDLFARWQWDNGGKLLAQGVYTQGLVANSGVQPIPPVGGGSAAPLRDNGGPGIAGMGYMIGKGQLQNEVYIPGASGQFVNDFVDLMKSVAAGVSGGNGQGGDTINVMMPKEALASPAAAQANGEIFGRAVADEMRARGIKSIK